MDPISIRTACLADLAAVEDVLGRSYRSLLKPDYPASVLVTALPLITRAKPDLLASGTYFVAEHEGRIVGAGGWSPGDPARGGARQHGLAHIRHVATDPALVRCGVARRLMLRILATARAAGFARLEALATRTAVPFYAAQGFTRVEDLDVPLAGIVPFPCVRMERNFG